MQTCDLDLGYHDSGIIMSKHCYKIGHRCQWYKNFFGIIFATSDVFPFDFDWGYPENGVIM